MKTRRWILLLPALAILIQIAYFYPRLPERVASHFDATGNPDGWSSKGSFLLTFLVSVGVLTLLFLGLSYALPKLPASLVNIPRKGHWLAPERREGTFAFMSRQLVWFAFGTQVFFVGILQLCIRANLEPGGGMQNALFLTYLGAYLVYTLAWTLHFICRFWKVPKDQDPLSPPAVG